jgi:TrmH family RNA methyltransferase
VTTITSRQNPLVVRFRAIAAGQTPHFLLLDGIHLVSEALDAGVQIQQAAIVADAAERPELARLGERLRRAGVDTVTVSASVIGALSPVRSPSPIVAIAARPLEGQVYASASPPLVVIAIGVQDPGNVGAMVRVAEAAGASGFVTAGACADPYTWKALRGSMGSALRLPIAVRRDSAAAIDEAKRYGCSVVATAPADGTSLFDVNLAGPVAILIGGEGPGLSAADVERADERVTIPMRSPVESLNTAVTAALVTYEARRQRTLRSLSEIIDHQSSSSNS